VPQADLAKPGAGGAPEAAPASLPSPSTPVGSAVDRSAPARRLLLAVLTDAIIVLRGNRPTGRYLERRDVEATTRWVRSDDRHSPCSFVNVCEALGLAHEPLRRRLLGPTAAQSARTTTRRRLLAGKRL
jgi:hypothetical protein